MAFKQIAVLFADSHLSDRTWSHRPIYGDSYCSFEQIIDYAIDHELPLFGAGDLIDRDLNRSEPIVFLSKQLQRLKEAGLKFYYTQGQHELADTPWLDIGDDNVKHLHHKGIKLSGVRIYGLDYQPAGNLQQELDKVPKKTDLLIAHQVWSDFMGSIAAPQGGMHDVPHAMMTFTGDYHYTEEIQVRNKTGRMMTVVSPGSTCMRSIDEPPDKYFFVLMYDEEEGDLKVERKPIRTRPMVDWDEQIQRESQMERYLDTIEHTLEEARDKFMDGCMDPETGSYPAAYHGMEEPLLRVIYSHRIEKGAKRIAEAIAKLPFPVHLFLKELPPEKPEVAERRKQRRENPSEAEAQTMETLLQDFLEKRDMANLQNPTQRLLQAAEPAAELQRMKKEALT